MAGIKIIKTNSFQPSFVGLNSNSSSKLFIDPHSKKNAQKNVLYLLNITIDNMVINTAFPM